MHAYIRTHARTQACMQGESLNSLRETYKNDFTNLFENDFYER